MSERRRIHVHIDRLVWRGAPPPRLSSIETAIAAHVRASFESQATPRDVRPGIGSQEASGDLTARIGLAVARAIHRKRSHE